MPNTPPESDDTVRIETRHRVCRCAMLLQAACVIVAVTASVNDRRLLPLLSTIHIPLMLVLFATYVNAALMCATLVMCMTTGPPNGRGVIQMLLAVFLFAAGVAGGLPLVM